MATALLLVLASVALPLARTTVIRNREITLRRDLRDMRDAIDRYKDLSDSGKITVEAGSEGYPPDLQTLVRGVVFGTNEKVRFLSKVPLDPMTGQSDWGLRSVQDDPDSDSWGGGNVFDVYSRSQGTALDGTKYSDW